jgi:hypothetical protein
MYGSNGWGYMHMTLEVHVVLKLNSLVFRNVSIFHMLVTMYESELHCIEEDHNLKRGVYMITLSGSGFKNCLAPGNFYDLKDIANLLRPHCK